MTMQGTRVAAEFDNDERFRRGTMQDACIFIHGFSLVDTLCCMTIIVWNL